MIAIICGSSYLIIGIICAVLCHKLATFKGYVGYVATGFFLGVIGLIYVGFLPTISMYQSHRSGTAVDNLGQTPLTHPSSGAAMPDQAQIDEPERAMPEPMIGIAQNNRSKTAAIDFGQKLITCPLCGAQQRSARNSCKRCGATFIDQSL